MFINDLEGVELETLTAKAIYGDKVNILVEDGVVFIQHKVGLGLKAQFNPLTSDKIGLKVIQTVLESGKYEIRPAWKGGIAVSNYRMDGNKVDLNDDGQYVRGVGNNVVEACCRALVIEAFGDDLGRMTWEEHYEESLTAAHSVSVNSQSGLNVNEEKHNERG